MKKLILLLSLLLFSWTGVFAGAQPAASPRNGRSNPPVAHNRLKTDPAAATSDVDVFSYSLSAFKVFGDRYSVSLAGLMDYYSFGGREGLFSTGGGLSFGYDGRTMGAGADYASMNFDQDIPSRDSYTIYYWIKLLSNANVSVSYGKSNIADTRESVRSGLSERYLDVQATYALSRALSFSFDVKSGAVNDGNTYWTEGLEAKALLSGAPSSWYTRLRLERQMYDQMSPDYYSPSDAVAYSALVGYNRDVNAGFSRKEGGDLHYSASLEVSGDSKSQPAVKPEIGVSVDVAKSVSVDARYSHTFAPSSSDDAASVSVTWKP